MLQLFYKLQSHTIAIGWSWATRSYAECPYWWTDLLFRAMRSAPSTFSLSRRNKAQRDVSTLHKLTHQVLRPLFSLRQKLALVTPVSDSTMSTSFSLGNGADTDLSRDLQISSSRDTFQAHHVIKTLARTTSHLDTGSWTLTDIPTDHEVWVSYLNSTIPGQRVVKIPPFYSPSSSDSNGTQIFIEIHTYRLYQYFSNRSGMYLAPTWLHKQRFTRY